MRRVIYSRKQVIDSSELVLYFNIEVGIDWEGSTNDVAASSYKGYDVPDGPLLPAEKDAIIDSQALADYHAFIDSVEDLLADYYDLYVYYKNESDDNSFYYGLLAKNSDGTLVLDFDFRLRISNHDPHRSLQSQHNKKLQDGALKKVSDGRKLKPLRAYIVVNNVNYDSYLDAYEEIDSQVESANEKLTRKQK